MRRDREKRKTNNNKQDMQTHARVRANGAKVNYMLLINRNWNKEINKN